MNATVVLAAALFCLSGSPPDQQVGDQISETPTAHNTFIEIDITEPVCVENAETAADATAEAVAGPAMTPPAATFEPIGKEVEPLDLIEPLFVEEAAVEIELHAVETTPFDSEAPAVQPIEPGAEAIDAPESAVVEPDAATETAIGADEEPAGKLANDEPLNDGSTASTGTTELDVESLEAIEPIILEDLEIIREPQPDAVAEPVDDPATATESPFVQSLEIIEPELMCTPCP